MILGDKNCLKNTFTIPSQTEQLNYGLVLEGVVKEGSKNAVTKYGVYEGDVGYVGLRVV